MKKSIPARAIIYALLVLLAIWLVYLPDRFQNLGWYVYGIRPGELFGLRGIIFGPLLHDTSDYNHILSNSIPIMVLTWAVFRFYAEIAGKVFIYGWLITGLLTWIIAKENYHIGISGLIYCYAIFLFLSGTLRRYPPLIGLSLLVVFLYGSLLWGIFPIPDHFHISWEGHLSGAIVGAVLAIYYKRKGPQQPKFIFELEEELGIEPEEEYWKEGYQPKEEQKEEPKIQINYSYKPKNQDKTSGE